jgi:hypothetical protein
MSSATQSSRREDIPKEEGSSAKAFLLTSRSVRLTNLLNTSGNVVNLLELKFTVYTDEMTHVLHSGPALTKIVFCCFKHALEEVNNLILTRE